MIEAFGAYNVGAAKSAAARPAQLSVDQVAAMIKRRGRSAQREFDESKRREQERARRQGRRGESYGDPFFLGMVAMAKELLIDLAQARIGQGGRHGR